MKPAVLFVNSLWTKHYDGTEEPAGNFAYFASEEYKRYGASDAHLFVPDKNGIHHCGLGQGGIKVESLDAVFVATDPSDKQHKIVALFQDLSWNVDKNGWAHGQALSKNVTCIPVHKRPVVDWPLGRHNRRWAHKWDGLLKSYKKLNKPQSPPPSSSSEAKLVGLYKDLKPQERERVVQQIKRALRDQKLRPAVLARWGASCAACGLKLTTSSGADECEVAHIHQVREDGSDSPSNALPLCRTHHWAFDRHLWGIEPKTLHMSVHEDHRKSPVLSGLHGAKLRPGKKDAQKHLDMAAVQLRWHRSGLEEP